MISQIHIAQLEFVNLNSHSVPGKLVGFEAYSITEVQFTEISGGHGDKTTSVKKLLTQGP